MEAALLVVSLYGALMAALFLVGWTQHRDVFHPWVFLIPQLVFLYTVMPLVVLTADARAFEFYVGGIDSFWRYELQIYLLTGCLLFGVLLGAGKQRATFRAWSPPAALNRKALLTVTVGLGLVAWASWVSMIIAVGGLDAAYGEAYGGGWISSGFIREGRFVGLVGALLVYATRVGKRMRPLDWALVAFCIAPVGLHGLLGARRGPTFVAAIVGLGGYIYFVRRRISMAVALPAGVALGTLILFLVANRGEIHLGSDVAAIDNNPIEFLERWSSNEYLLGSAIQRYEEQYGSFYGTRQLSQLLGRIIPSALWPTAWDVIPAFFGIETNLRVNGGVDHGGIYSAVGWSPSSGSAVGFVGDQTLEYGPFAPLAGLAIGYIYGLLWRTSASTPKVRMLYLLMAALSVYLIMQSQNAWLYRTLLLGGPAYLLSAIYFRKVQKGASAYPAPMRYVHRRNYA